MTTRSAATAVSNSPFSFEERIARWFLQLPRLLARHSPDNSFLQGPYAPVDSESTAENLPVRGQIPPELNGVLARIGPNPFDVPNPGTHHWFAGHGMVHGVRIRDGRALWYRNRWVGTDDANRRLGKPAAPGGRHGVDRAVNTNVFGHAGRIWASVEAGAFPVELDEEFNTLKHGLFDSPERLSFSAHPHLDPHTGEIHAVCYDGLKRNKLHYLSVDASAQLVRRVDIPVKHGPMVHDCAITAKHVVIMDLPVTFSWGEILRGSNFPYAWNPRHPARVGLLPRDGGAEDIRWFQIDPCYVFHTCNAFEREDGSVVMDVAVHPEMFRRKHNGPEGGDVNFERWILPADGDTVQRQVWGAAPQEFPRFDERRTAQDYRYAYTVGIDTEHSGDAQPVYRYDLKTGQRIQHDFGPNNICSEAVFVPRNADSAEDDGWVMCYTYDLSTDDCAVVILNAQDLEGEPQAVIDLPVRAPMGFHGNWIAMG